MSRKTSPSSPIHNPQPANRNPPTFRNPQSEIRNSPTPFPPRFRWLKRFALGFLVVLLLLLCQRWWWSWIAHRRLQTEIDRLIAAGEPIHLEDFAPPAVPDEQNGAKLLLEAMESIKLTPEQTQFFEALESHTWIAEEDLGRAAKIVRVNREVFQLVRQARDLPGADWGVEFSNPTRLILYSNLRDLRRLSRLLVFAAAYAHTEGDDATAVATLQDLWSSTERAQQGMPALVTHLVVVANQRWVTEAIELMGGDLNIALDSRIDKGAAATRTEVQLLIQLLLDEATLKQGFIRSLQCERMFQLGMIRQFVDGTISTNSLTTVGGTSGPAPLSERLLLYVFLPQFELNTIRMLDHMSRIIEAAAEPDWTAARPVVASLDSQADRLRLRRSFRVTNSMVLVPTFLSAFRSYYCHLAERRMAAIALAIRLYQLDHGHRPATLDELMPDYLDAVPRDPMAGDGSAIRYRLEPQAVLYSIGPNGIDNGGAWILRVNRTIDREQSDLVFYLNGGFCPNPGFAIP